MIQPPTVDRNLDINLHPLEGASIPIVRFDNGVQVDISLSSLVFELKGTVSIPLVAHPTDVKGRLIVITKDHIKSVPKNGTPFALVDKTNSAIPIVRWVGILKKVEW